MPSDTPPTELLSTGQIARRLAVPIFRVNLAIQNLGLEPAARIGNVRAFNPDQVAAIKEGVARIRVRVRP